MVNRSITVLSLVQVACVLIGFLALCLVFKFLGYPSETPMDDPLASWSPFALFLRHHGLGLLFLPVFWTFGAVAAERRRSGFWQEGTALLAGSLICMAVILGFVYAGLFPFTRHFLIIPG